MGYLPRRKQRQSLPRAGRIAALLLLGLVLLLAFPVHGYAQDIIIDPPPFPPPEPPPFPRLDRIHLRDHRVEARIDGPVASVRVIQRFQNTTGRTVEGTYLFPLPADAAVSDFQMTVDGAVLEGKVLPADEAKRIYEEIVRRRRDPALLEYVGRSLFQASVFPIPPGEERTVELSYRQVLTRDGGLYRFRYPMGRAGENGPDSFALSAELHNQPGLRAVYSPSHNISLEREGDEGALVSFETRDPAEMGEFSLYFGTDESAIGVNLLSYKPAGEEGYFLLIAAPGLEAAPREVVARDVVVVIDVSGSMEGEKIEQARAAARHVVQHLNPGDRFGLVSFSTGTDVWRTTLRDTSSANRQDALDWIDDLVASGSTDINRALLEALALLNIDTLVRARPPTERPAYLLFLTDGLPTVGEQEPERIIANGEQNAPRERLIRLFTFGVGFDVNTDLLDTLSKNLGGRSSYVAPEERIDEAVSGFYANISTPVLTDVAIDVVGASPEDTYPFPLPDLFAGEQLIWVGRYAGGGAVTVTLAGTVNGEERRFTFDDLSLATAGGEEAVARLWATRKIGALLGEIRRGGAGEELVEEIVDLSLRFGIVTPYTSYLVLEPDLDQNRGSGFVAPVAPRAEAEGRMVESLRSYSTADAVGEAAVAASEVRGELEEARTTREVQGVRYLAGKSFVQQGSVTAAEGVESPFWVDTGYDEAMSLRTVAFGGEEYFRLAADPRIGRWLTLSPEMVLVVEGEAIRITLTGADEAETDSELAPAPSDRPGESGSLWQRLFDLFKGFVPQP